jgi:hypothetical protein
MLNALFWVKKQHFSSPFHFLLTRLSLVKITPWLRYQRKILIFKGSFTFQLMHLWGVPSYFIMSLYIDCVEKTLLPRHQMKASSWSSSCTCSIDPTSCIQLSLLTPTKAPRKETLSGEELNTGQQ